MEGSGAAGSEKDFGTSLSLRCHGVLACEAWVPRIPEKYLVRYTKARSDINNHNVRVTTD